MYRSTASALRLVSKCFVGMAVALCGVSRADAADEGAEAKKEPAVTYEENVQAIFRQHCFTCHGPDTAKSDLRLDTYAAMMRGGASGAVIEPGDADSSRLWKLVAHEETPEMPPKQDKLPAETLAVLKQWITLGALEKAGSTAKIKAKPKVSMTVSAGAGKPEGPPPMPEVPLTRQPIVYTPRAGAVSALAASPWAPLLAVAGQKQIVLYNSDTAQLLGVLPFPEGTPQVLRFSRSGAVLLAGGGRGGQSGRVALYDVRTGQRLTEIGDELDTVLAADINDDHTQVALGGPRRIVKIYSVADGALLHEIRKHTDWITAIEYSPDGVLLATGDRSSGMFVWEADTAREYQNLKGHTAAISGVSWRIDGNILASTSEDGTVKLWEMEGGQQVKNWNAHAGGGSSVQFAMDGRLASCGRDRIVKLWDQNGQQLRAFEATSGDIPLRTVVTHDGARVVAGDWAGEIRIWSAGDGALAGRLVSNPPTLAMAADAETARSAAAQAAAEKAAAEAAAAQTAVNEKSAAATALAERLKTLQAEIDALAADKAAAEKLLAEKAAAAKTAGEAAASAAAAAQRAAEERDAFEKTKTAQANAN